MQLITHSTNLLYLLNFSGSSGFLIRGENKNYFFTDFRYRQIAEKLEKSNTRIPFEFVEMDKNFKEKLQKICARSKTIEFEANHVTVNGLNHWKKLLPKKKWQTIK